MSTTVVPPVGEEKKFDPKAFIATRNAADKPTSSTGAVVADGEKAKPTAPADPIAEAAESGPDKPRMSRSQRREHNRLLREVGEAQGRAKALEELLAKGTKAAEGSTAQTAEAAGDDPKPARTAFASDAAFHEAVAAWSGRQEARKTIGQTQELESLRSDLAAAAAKAEQDAAWLPEYAKVAKEAEEDERLDFIPAEHGQLMLMIGKSDVQAHLWLYWASHPAEFQTMLQLSKSDPQQQIVRFHRLEGRVENLYKKPAAQAASTKTEDRTDGEKPEQGSDAASRDARKPKPSAEVAVRGGNAAPDDPKPGSKEWMARRNQAQFAK